MKWIGATRSGKRRSGRAVGLAGLVLLAVGCLPALDPGFGGGDGVVVVFEGTGTYGELGTPNEVATLPGGKILVLYSGSGGRLFLTRLDPDGSADTTFGDNGRVDLGVDGVSPCSDLLVLPDGKLLVSTKDNNSLTNDPTLVRFNSDGTRDMTFGTGGGAWLPVPEQDYFSKACDLALQPDGKIVATVDLSSSLGLTVARWLPDGTVDAGFDTDGMASMYVANPAPYGLEEWEGALAVQGDGKVVVVGGGRGPVGDDDPPHMVIARFTTDGRPDHSFANQGGLYEALGGQAVDVAVRPNGRILVTGTVVPRWSSDGTGQFYLLQIDSAGGRDRAFGTDGVVIAGQDVHAGAMRLLEDGRVLIVGGEWPYGFLDTDADPHDGFVLARYLLDGRLDGSFGTDGISTTDRFDGNERAMELAVQPDGKLLVAGITPGRSGTTDVAVYRFNA